MSSNPSVTIGITAVDKASGVLKSLDQQVVGTTSKIDESNAKATKSTEKSSQSMIRSYASIATSVASLGAGIVSFATSFSTLEKAQNRVDLANLSLANSQARLEKLQQSGKATADDLARANEDVRVKSEQLRIAQGDLSDTTMNFYAQMPAQLISFGTAATSALTAYSAGAKGATLSTQTLGHAFKVAMLGPPPIGLILTGVGIAATLVATHFDEISAALQYAGDVVHDFLTAHFKPLADLLDWFIDGLNALGAGLNTGVTPAYAQASEATGEFTNETINAGTAIAKTAKEVDTYISYLHDLQQDTAKSTRENMWLIESLDKETAALVKNRFEIELVAGYLQDQQRELQRTREENFNLVASVHGVDEALKMLRDGSLTQVAEGLKQVQDGAEKATEAIDKLNKKAKGSLEDRARSAFGDLGDLVKSGNGRATFVKKHAQGGVIDEPTAMLGLRTGQLGLAGEAGPETIVPGIADSVGYGGRKELHIHLNMNGKELAHEIYDDIIREFSRRKMGSQRRFIA